MFLLKVTPVLLLVIAVTAEKKIELQDIEEDNLKSENEKDFEDQPEARSQTDATGPSSGPMEYFKNGFLRYFEAQNQPQQQRYVQQYAVSEAPERASVTPKPQFASPPTAQQAMVGYLSNVPMQIYLVPQYYSEASEQAAPQQGLQYQAVARVAGYQTQQEHGQSHANYVDVPTYVAPTAKAYIQQYTQPVAYVSYPQPTIAPVQATVAPVLTYQMPVVQYPTAIVTQQPPKAYYQNPQFTGPSGVEELQDNEIDNQKYYSTQTEAPYKSPEFPRHYNSRTPLREEYRSGPSELPRPSSLLLKPSPSHLSHIPKALPIYRPPKPVYGTPNFIPAPITPRPFDAYLPKSRPASLLDSYIPSSVQAEYLKRGFIKDPLVLFETLSSGRHFPPPVIPRHYERGFLPNQMYHTASGGITYGHHKRSSKGDKVPQK
ncbi:uncharacterized protein [Epargyreus clarus]|uniref:uncharacterized protein n=1 Tax=Epargyreus clarus TaxID=520877 RepID=UPI003C30C737